VAQPAPTETQPHPSAKLSPSLEETVPFHLNRGRSQPIIPCSLLFQDSQREVGTEASSDTSITL
jgi:hypothetical protein